MLLKGAQERGASCLKDLALSHPCARHPLFDYLRERSITHKQAVALLTNYDAHAALLRRLLLKAAANMPEPAVGFILENVRNEYGNGDYSLCHQDQLLDLKERVRIAGNLSPQVVPITEGVKSYVGNVGRFYDPLPAEGAVPEVGSGEVVNVEVENVVDYFVPGYVVKNGKRFYAPAITAGAVTATELMAIEEFKAMQVAFHSFGLADHVWFDHVNVECDHGEESLALAEFFWDKHDGGDAVEYGFNSTLDVNVHLYDGLLSALKDAE